MTAPPAMPVFCQGRGSLNSWHALMGSRGPACPKVARLRASAAMFGIRCHCQLLSRSWRWQAHAHWPHFFRSDRFRHRHVSSVRGDLNLSLPSNASGLTAVLSAYLLHK